MDLPRGILGQEPGQSPFERCRGAHRTTQIIDDGNDGDEQVDSIKKKSLKSDEEPRCSYRESYKQQRLTGASHFPYDPFLVASNLNPVLNLRADASKKNLTLLDPRQHVLNLRVTIAKITHSSIIHRLS